MEHRSHLRSKDAQSADTVCTLLSDRHRRYVVDFLADRESSIALDELAAAVAARAIETESDGVPPERTETVATTLHHAHLPKLAAADVVDYDTETNTVTPTGTEILTPFLERVDGGP